MQLLMESHGGGAGPCVDISSCQRTCFTKAHITVPCIKAIEVDGEAGSSVRAHPDDSCSHRIGTPFVLHLLLEWLMLHTGFHTHTPNCCETAVATSCLTHYSFGNNVKAIAADTEQWRAGYQDSQNASKRFPLTQMVHKLALYLPLLRFVIPIMNE